MYNMQYARERVHRASRTGVGCGDGTGVGTGVVTITVKVLALCETPAVVAPGTATLDVGTATLAADVARAFVVVDVPEPKLPSREI